MSYFNRLGKAKFKIGNNYWILDDLTKVVTNKPDLFYNNTYLEDYYIISDSRPDIISNTLYQNVDHWWTLFILNNITPNDWPLGDIEFRESIERKYNAYELNKVVRYEDDGGVEYPEYGWRSFEGNGKEIIHHVGRMEDFLTSSPLCGVSKSNKNPITRYVYEERLNEAKRSIKIVKPSRIQDFVNDFNNKINGKVTF